MPGSAGSVGSVGSVPGSAGSVGSVGSVPGSVGSVGVVSSAGLCSVTASTTVMSAVRYVVIAMLSAVTSTFVKFGVYSWFCTAEKSKSMSSRTS